LRTYGLTQSETDVVLNKNKEKLHQVACLRLYEFSHKDSVANNVGNHPNNYFNSSIEYKKSLEKPQNKS